MGAVGPEAITHPKAFCISACCVLRWLGLSSWTSMLSLNRSLHPRRAAATRHRHQRARRKIFSRGGLCVWQMAARQKVTSHLWHWVWAVLGRRGREYAIIKATSKVSTCCSLNVGGAVGPQRFSESSAERCYRPAFYVTGVLAPVECQRRLIWAISRVRFSCC